MSKKSGTMLIKSKQWTEMYSSAFDGDLETIVDKLIGWISDSRVEGFKGVLIEESTRDDLFDVIYYKIETPEEQEKRLAKLVEDKKMERALPIASAKKEISRLKKKITRLEE